jgi:hypothetical protein
MNIPELQEGERYAGVILNEDGTLSHHLILLPKQPTERLTWNEAVVWAQVELPTRQEQSLLFANCKGAFEPAWYWSSEQYASNAYYAWYQFFGNGTQDYDGKGYKGRVRAVRRVHI